MNLLGLSLIALLHVMNVVTPASPPLVLTRTSTTQAAALWQAVPATLRTQDPFAFVPHELVVSRTSVGRVTLGPTGAGGPPAAAAFDALSATTEWDRLKADRVAILPAVGAGVVLTLTKF